MTSSTARFLIARHIPDLFRREPNNIGVIVEKDGDRAAVFVAEQRPGEFDGRKLRRFQHASVYTQWVEYWRSAIADGQGLDQLIQSNGSHYQLLDGGSVSDTGSDSADNIASYLYSLLISDGGFAEATSTSDAAAAARARQSFTQELESEFVARRVLATEEMILDYVRYPVRPNVQLRGEKVPEHTASFAQRNGRLYVMECIDFEKQRGNSLKDHTGWIAFMFDDIKSWKPIGGLATETISIVRSIDRDEAATSKYAFELLKAGSDRIIDWDDADQREAFLKEREAVATSEA
jgi:hypothetical protein